MKRISETDRLRRTCWKISENQMHDLLFNFKNAVHKCCEWRESLAGDNEEFRIRPRITALGWNKYYESPSRKATYTFRYVVKESRIHELFYLLPLTPPLSQPCHKLLSPIWDRAMSLKEFTVGLQNNVYSITFIFFLVITRSDTRLGIENKEEMLGFT